MNALKRNTICLINALSGGSFVLKKLRETEGAIEGELDVAEGLRDALFDVQVRGSGMICYLERDFLDEEDVQKSFVQKMMQAPLEVAVAEAQQQLEKAEDRISFLCAVRCIVRERIDQSEELIVRSANAESFKERWQIFNTFRTTPLFII